MSVFSDPPPPSFGSLICDVPDPSQVFKCGVILHGSTHLVP